MRHPSNRGERKVARDKVRRKVESKERYDSGRKWQERGPDFSPADRDRKAVKTDKREWAELSRLLPPGAIELTKNKLFFGGKAAGHDKYLRF